MLGSHNEVLMHYLGLTRIPKLLYNGKGSRAGSCVSCHYGMTEPGIRVIGMRKTSAAFRTHIVNLTAIIGKQKGTGLTLRYIIALIICPEVHKFKFSWFERKVTGNPCDIGPGKYR